MTDKRGWLVQVILYWQYLSCWCTGDGTRTSPYWLASILPPGYGRTLVEGGAVDAAAISENRAGVLEIFFSLCLLKTQPQTHMRTHSGDRPFRCNLCDKRFVTSNALTTHLRAHWGLRLHPCPVCDRQFSTSSNLRVHHRVGLLAS